MVAVTAQADVVVEAALEALAASPGVYQRAGALVQVVREPPRPTGVKRPPGAPRIAEIREARMLELLAARAHWVERTVDSKGKPRERHVLPPTWAVKAVLHRGEWPRINPLFGVVETPVLRADGSILAEPGYDEATGLLYQPPAPLNLALQLFPSKEDAARAGRDLIDVVADFPFGDSTSGPAAWVAAVLTPLARCAFSGPAPLFLADGNTRGCGKSLLMDLVAAIVTGRDMTRIAPPASDEEMGKLITALALAGDPLVLIDNVVAAFGWPSLDAALTGQSWDGRVLGQSRMTGRLELTATWLATGNNVILAADVVRRVLRIRLETLEERPEERTGFRHEDLRRYVMERRPALLAASLTVLRAYCLAGRPAQPLPAWGSFEAWSGLVRSAIHWAGLGDPAAERAEYVSAADQEHALLEALLAGWSFLMGDRTRGLTVDEAVRQVGEQPFDGEAPEVAALRWALGELGGEPLSKRRIGKALARLKRRVVAGRFLDCGQDRNLGVARWSVVEVGP